MRVWTFTTAAHPAHAAVACRTVTAAPSGGSTVNMAITCLNARERHDALYGEFEALNGRVQGVWSRDWTVEQARALGLAGWVRNRTDDAWRSWLRGKESALAELEQRCRVEKR